MKNIFTEHPKSIGESYFKHFVFAVSTGIKLLLWGLIAVIHGILPFTFKTYVSSRIKELYHKINKRWCKSKIKNLFCYLKIITQALAYFPHRLVYATLTKILLFELKEIMPEHKMEEN